MEILKIKNALGQWVEIPAIKGKDGTTTPEYIALAEQIAQNAENVSADTATVATKTQTVINKALEVANNTTTATNKANQVNTQALEVAENTSNVVLKTTLVLNSAVAVAQQSAEVDLNAQAVATGVLLMAGYKAEVIADKNIVSADKAIVLEKSADVNNKASAVNQKALDVEADRAEVATNTATVGTNTQTAIVKALEAFNSAAAALVSEQHAKTSEDNAGESETEALRAMGLAVQAMTDLLAMLGTDIATLTGGKLTPSQIPVLSIIDTYPVANYAEMLLLDCQKGDVAVVADNGDGYSEINILSADDPSNLADWVLLSLPTNYVNEARHATTADNATNSAKINGHRLVTMTESQYAVAVLEDNTLYAVYPDEV